MTRGFLNGNLKAATVTVETGGALRTSTSNGNTALLQAYDVDGAAYTTFVTLTAGNTPTCDLSTAVTIGGQPIGTGTVTSVSGTANRITSTGGATPVIDISASYVGQASITTLGTVTTGVWNGTVVDVSHGGTGLSSATAYAVLCGGTTSTGAFQSIAGVGTSGQVLTSNGAGALPTFQAAAGGIPTIGTSTNTAIVKWNGTTGSAVSDTGILINASNQLINVAGSAGAPSICFTSNTNMGFWRSAADTIGISFLGAQFSQWSGSGFTSVVTGRYNLQESASDSAPTYSFASDGNSGWYRSAADTLHMVTAGAKAQSWDSSGRNTFPLQPSFLAYLATTATDKTGNAGSYTLGTDALTEVFDRGNNFNTNGTFTAPVTGLYDLKAQITITGTTIATSFVISIVTTARTYTSTFTRAAASTDQTVFIACLADMTATNTATVTIVASGEAGNTDDIKGGATLETYFCGTLVA
jgi:hypothetical protein